MLIRTWSRVSPHYLILFNLNVFLLETIFFLNKNACLRHFSKTLTRFVISCFAKQKQTQSSFIWCFANGLLQNGPGGRMSSTTQFTYLWKFNCNIVQRTMIVAFCRGFETLVKQTRELRTDMLDSNLRLPTDVN